MKKYGIQLPGLVLLVVVVLFLLVGCKAVEEPLPGINDEDSLLGATSPKLSEEAAKAMQLEKSISGVEAVIMKDLDGNRVDRTFTTLEITAIETAFNESFIMDTAYIDMIAGNTMTLELKDGRQVFITSYGQEGYIVARIGDEFSYHLGCEFIGKILLEQ